MRRRVLGMILAGGRGNRLEPLTTVRSKPAVPFGANYRIIDFVLSNFVNSGLRSIYVLTQFKSQSLAEHLHDAWAGHMLAGNFVIPVPAQMQTAGAVWYQGTADAIFQNLNLVRETRSDLVSIFGGDHIYFMDIRQMLRFHLKHEADVTIAALPVSREEARRFGVVEADADGRVRAFHEKVEDPPAMPGDPDRCYGSMGNYVFSRAVLEEVLERDAADGASSHDFGSDVLPAMVAEGRRVFAYDFERNRVPGHPEDEPNRYWRDVGTIEAYFDAQLDLKDPVPHLDLYNREWPVRTVPSGMPPAKLVHAGGRAGEAPDSVLGPGTLVSGATVRDSVIGRNVRVEQGALVEQSILMDGVRVERDCRIRRAIVDKNVVLATGTTVGHDHDADRARGWTVSNTGIVVIPKNPLARPLPALDL